MTQQSGNRPERRQFSRIAPKGAVLLRSADYVQRGRLSNISQRGLFMMTSAVAPEWLLARQASLEIRLDTAAAEWLNATGTIVRIQPDGIAVVFDEPHPALVRMIKDATGASNADDRRLTVVLIDANETRRNLMSEGFRAIGCALIEVGSSLEAIVRLGELGFEPNVIAVADSLPTREADEMRAFIEREHHAAQLVTIGDELLEPEGMEYWLSSANPARDLSQRVREVLLRWRVR